MLLSESFREFIRQEVVLKGGADKTRRNYLTAQNSLLAAVGDIPAQLLTLEHVKRWQEYMLSLGHQPSSIKGCLCKLRRVLKFLGSRGINVLDYRTIDLPTVKRTKREVLDYSEVQKLIDATDNPRDKAIVACLFSTACRISELLSLNRGDIQNGEAAIIGKGDKQNTIFFDEVALRLLDDYLGTRNDKLPPLFISGQYRRITVSRVEQIIHVLTAAAGLEKIVTPHVFRHSALTDYVLNGAPMPMVQRIAGHSSIQTTIDTYTHIPQEAIRETFHKYHSK